MGCWTENIKTRFGLGWEDIMAKAKKTAKAKKSDPEVEVEVQGNTPMEMR